MRKPTWFYLSLLLPVTACSVPADSTVADDSDDEESAPGDAGSAKTPVLDAATRVNGNMAGKVGSEAAEVAKEPASTRVDAGPAVDEDRCGGETHVAQGKELEILILFDNSWSMVLPALTVECLTTGNNCPQTATGLPPTLWEVAVAEMKAFVSDPASAGVSVALKYFGTECSADFYSKPDVPIGMLPAHAAALEQSLAATLPSAETATRPALEGALEFVRARAASPDYHARTVILLFTDGYPDEIDCERNSTQAVAEVAAQGFRGEPSIATHVFVTSPDLKLDEIAVAGGTNKTIVADLSRAGTLSAALNSLRSQEVAALPCDYRLPPEYFTEVNDPGLVNLTHNGKSLGKVTDASACHETLGGWFYDDPTKPSRILTCPVTCTELKGGGAIDVQLKCPSMILI